jgi:glyoxylase-like metal-dependent hydrolase (beta-lactamase superfamily II)
VQAIFKRIFNPEPALPPMGANWTTSSRDGEAFPIGKLAARALHTPGHTPADLTYLVGDAAFVGETLLMPDYGTARADFPGGDAGLLYRSIRRILELPADTPLFTCHDYKAAGPRSLCHKQLGRTLLWVARSKFVTGLGRRVRRRRRATVRRSPPTSTAPRRFSTTCAARVMADPDGLNPLAPQRAPG